MLSFSSVPHSVRPAQFVKAAGVLALLGSTLLASSHSDAPLIKQDPQANLTDVYAFIGTLYNDPSKQVLNVVVNVHPFSEPGDGVMYERFADDALYSINIADPNTGALIRSYNFRFSPVSSKAGTYKNLSTILSYGRGTTIGPIMNVNDSAQNFTQSYTVTEYDPAAHPPSSDDYTDSYHGIELTTNSQTPLLVPPPNVGRRTTPAYNDANGVALTGATTNAGLDTYTKETIYSFGTGEAVWAGPRDDSFFADAAGIFDLLDPRILGPDGHGQTGNGVDGFKGFNVLTLAIQIPLSNLPQISYMDAFTGASKGVGVYASVSRPKVTLRSNHKDPDSEGPWIQVNRLGNPLFNEVLVALKDKDNYNRDVPTDDAAKYKTYALSPELPVLINAVFGLSLATTGRSDLAAVYIPDVLRVDTTTGPVPLIGAGGNRLSGLGGDTTGGKWSGWPNGRRLGDDVVDIALTAIASGPTYSSIFVLGDNINHNDFTYNFVFPYAATPHAGTTNRKDPGIPDGTP
jgi:Domain of unknown function (DUF4331)